jgi:hypothetical protein
VGDRTRTTTAPATLRIVIPLTLRKRNGRPRILPPADLQAWGSERPEPHVLRVIARAWVWRRRLEAGIASTIGDIAAAEKLSDRFVSHATRLAYLASVSLRGWSRNASRRR